MGFRWAPLAGRHALLVWSLEAAAGCTFLETTLPMGEMNTEELWQLSLGRCDLNDPGHRVLEELTALYSERHRKYHNLQHVLDCLHYLETFPVEAADSPSLELALWFHDAIYQPLKGGNELASADMAVDRLSRMGASRERQQKVHRLIMATTHDAEPRDLDEAVMIDVDLAILGRDRGSFEAYEANVRSEYRLVPGPLFRRKRKEILESFVERSSIYNTDPFREHFEVAARDNLKWAIARL